MSEVVARLPLAAGHHAVEEGGDGQQLLGAHVRREAGVPRRAVQLVEVGREHQRRRVVLLGLAALTRAPALQLERRRLVLRVACAHPAHEQTISRDGAAAEEEESPLAVGSKTAREWCTGNVGGRAKVRPRTVRRGALAGAAGGLR